jgi:phosphoglycolate phosphatase
VTGSAVALVVFDWDGTLMDSQQRIVASLRETIAERHLPTRGDPELREVIGLALPQALLALFPHLDGADLQALMQAYRQQFIKCCRQPESLFDGAREVILELRSQGLLLAIATGKGRAGLDRALKQTSLMAEFHYTRCADEAPSKPDPTMLWQIMERLQVTPSASLMIGDTEYDLAMARAAGIRSVAALYGTHERERLLQHRPAAVLEHIDELPLRLTELRG